MGAFANANGAAGQVIIAFFLSLQLNESFSL
jgi:hypothetical protein